jgi:hypothetical protein
MKTKRNPALLLVLLLALGAARAGADELSGHGLVVAKDVAHGTLTLDGGRLLRISERSVLEGVEGGRITLAEIGVAEDAGGGYGAVPNASVRFEGQPQGREIRVEHLRVLRGPVQ